MAQHNNPYWWLPIALLGVTMTVGLIAWYWKRMLDRLDNAHDGVFKDGGPVSTVRQELITIRRHIANFMTREEGEQNNKALHTYLETIRTESKEREERLMRAIEKQHGLIKEDVSELKEDIRLVSKRIDNITDHR